MYQRLVLVGPPGGGKGTLAERLAKEMDVPHVSTGDMLRREVAESTGLGRQAQSFMDLGQLVPDELVTQMTVARLSRADANKGWILDGFPRDLHQAQRFDDLLKTDGVELVLALEVIDQEVFKRIRGRRSCPLGHIYHVTRNPPKRDGVCDEDGLPLEQRQDAAVEVIQRRLAIYQEEIAPLLDFYEQRRLVRRIDGMGTPDEVYRRLIAAVRGDRSRPTREAEEGSVP